MCPHVPGTDARQNLKLKTLEIPSAALEVNGGRIVFELDTLDMLDDDIEDIDVVFELDGATALFPVSFDIGSASLNQPLGFSIKARERSKAYISFQRNDPNLKSIQIGGSVRSKCDDSISERFGFQVEWSSQCPPVHWGGDLSPLDSHFELTSKRQDLDITAVNPTGK